MATSHRLQRGVIMFVVATLLTVIFSASNVASQSNGCVCNNNGGGNGNGNNGNGNGNAGNQCVNGALAKGDSTSVAFMEPLQTWSFIYECQNATLFLAVYNMSLNAYNSALQPINHLVNTVTCATSVPAGPSANVFDVNTFNSCDDAGSCGNCGGCNCTCRTNNPWWWNCCQDPCFGCSACCRCPTNNWNWNWVNGGSCLQCNHDGWYTPNGQLMTPTVCQFALAAVNPNNVLDYESLAPSNFSYQVRILQRTIGCQACNAQALANITIYVKDCNEYPVFDMTKNHVSIYQYEGITGLFSGPTLNVIVQDPDLYTPQYGTVDLVVQRVDLTNVGAVNPIPFYITNSHFVNSNSNPSVLNYDASRCGAAITACLDMFRYSYSGAATPIFTIYVLAIDGGGLISTFSYSITILNTPLNPSWINMPATISVVEGTPGVAQIYPMQAIVPGFSVHNTVQFSVINVAPAVAAAGGPYIDATMPCLPAAATAVQCGSLYLTAAVGPATLNYATQQQYNVTVWMTNQVAGSGTIFTISSWVLIKILQRIYQPTLTPASDAVWLKENVTGQACFYQITGISSQNGHTSFLFSFAAPPTHNAFYLNGSRICYDSARQASGPAAAPSWTFDASVTNLYTFNIIVNDPLSTMVPPTFVLTVNIANVEDPPILTVPVFQTIPETATSWTVVIGATKEANQAALTFALVNQNAASYNQMWYISTQTSSFGSTVASATIMANPNIVPSPMFNFTVAPVIYLDVIAYTPTYTVSGKITFFIQRVNTPPYFTNLPNRTSIAEAVTGFVTIFTVTTADRESDPRLVYFRDPLTGALSSYDPSGKFFIDPALDIITTNIPPNTPGFNFYATPSYTLTVCCVDSPPFTQVPATATQTFVVFIVLNQTAPTFTTPLPGPNAPGSTIVPHIPETTTGQKYIFTLQATDREGDFIFYNITDVRPRWNTAFRIPWPSNLVEYNSDYATTTPMFDNKRYPVYYIVIEATDQKTNPTSTTTLTVSIDHVDKPAQWTSLPALVTIREDVYWGPTDLIAIQAIDPNGLYPVTINFIGVSPAFGSSQLYYNPANKNAGYNMDPKFSYGVASSYTMLFSAFNTILPTVTSSLVVQIIKVPTGPSINLTNAVVYLHENVTAGQTLWDMRVKDNSSLSLKYNIFDISPNGFSKFYVTNTGLIRSVDKPGFNYQSAPVYVIRTTSTNSAGLAVTFTLTVSIIDDPEPPIITNLPNFASVKEGVIGSNYGPLFSARCTDQDGRAVTWQYDVLPHVGSNYFNMTSSGVISTTPKASFSYADQSYYYVVGFCSNGYYTTTGTLTVVVVWSTSTTSTSPRPRVTIPDGIVTEAVTSSGDLLTPEQIGAIVGSLLGALVLALGAWGLARLLQRKVREDGLTNNMKVNLSTRTVRV